jgi:hypothetical protein
MKKINLIGGPFQHAHSSTWWKKPKHIEWVKNSFREDITIFVDDSITSGLSYPALAGKKYAWNVESRKIYSIDGILSNIDKLLDYYDLIFTHNQELINKNPDKIKFIPANGFWVENPKIYEKSKLISIVSSNKQSTDGQRKRIDFINQNRNRVDVFGRGFNPIEKKDEGLKDYMFSVAIENNKYDTYFTEKILDCFATGTIPIYYGTDKISDFFNKDGIIRYEDFDIGVLNEELYQSKMDAIKDNFERVKDYEIPEDIIYKNRSDKSNK